MDSAEETCQADCPRGEHGYCLLHDGEARHWLNLLESDPSSEDDDSIPVDPMLNRHDISGASMSGMGATEDRVTLGT